MKTKCSLVLLAFVIEFGASLCLPLAGRSADRAPRKQNYTTNTVDEAACERQLSILHDALQEYRQRYQRFPKWLSELTPEFIHDPKMLVCPFVDNSGNLKNWRQDFVTVPVFGDPGSCSYAYEFCTEPFVYVPGWTTRDYKQHQMQVMGFGVPIVRCFAHRPILNLGLDATIYPSPGEWEDNFATAVQNKAALHDVLLLTNSSQNQIVRNIVEPRAAGLDPRLVDLSLHYNATLLHLGRVDRSGKLLLALPQGLQTPGGVGFDIRGLIHLAGRNFPITFPESVTNITVNRKCVSIHFLHGAIFAAPKEQTIASYVVHYADGRTNAIPVVYGRDVETRWFDVRQGAEPGGPKSAWVSPSNKTDPSGQSLRLFQTTWRNGTPDAEVRSIDLLSHLAESAPFVVAITVE